MTERLLYFQTQMEHDFGFVGQRSITHGFHNRILNLQLESEMRELYTEQHTSVFTLFNHASQYVGTVCLKTDLQATSFKNIPPLRLSSSYPILRNTGNGIPARYLIRVRTQM